jgi:hypothetical protein
MQIFRLNGNTEMMDPLSLRDYPAVLETTARGAAGGGSGKGCAAGAGAGAGADAGGNGIVRIHVSLRE